MFDDSDLDCLMNSYSGGFFDVLFQAALDINDLTVDEAKKN